MPIVSEYKAAVGRRSARAMLKMPPLALDKLVSEGFLERVGGAAAVMLGDEEHVTRSSIERLLAAVKCRAKVRTDSQVVKLMSAVRVFKPDIPWATILRLAVEGVLPVVRNGQRSRDWRHNVAVTDLNEFRKLVESAATSETPSVGEWVTADEAGQLLGVDDRKVIAAMSAAGLLAKRPTRMHLYRRVDVESVAKKYILGPEMLERTVFNIYHEMTRWLRAQGIEPEFRFVGRVMYDRRKFEGIVAHQPTRLERIERSGRLYSTAQKQTVVDAVLGGASIGWVSRGMGVKRREINKWLSELQGGRG